MRVHFLQHVPFEGLGSIEPWLSARGGLITSTRLYEDARLPSVRDLDWLFVMGGPMGASDDARHPWLAPERGLIAEAVATGKVVLGVCLGAQLIAKALGACVFPNREREIGWFPLEPVAPASRSAGTEAGADDASGGARCPLPTEAFHWHGDTFDLPASAVHLARSAACAHQAFAVGPRVLGLQFHLEMTFAGAAALIEACRDELRAAPWTQSESEMLSDPTRFERSNRAMDEVLEWLARTGP